jgi:hypothetical protein
MRTKAFKYGSLLIGLIAALVIILTQSISIDPSSGKQNTPHPSETTSHEESKSSSDFSIQTISATSFPATAQINFFQEASCLFEIIFTTNVPSSEMDNIEIPINKFYSTILRVFISPNAP